MTIRGRLDPPRVTEGTRLRALAAAVRGVVAAFACHGRVRVPAPIELRLRGGRAIRVDDSRGYQTTLGKRLLKQCDPAPFGVGGDTRYDARVRDGGQLRADDEDALDVSGLDLGKSGILAEVRRSLCPGDRQLPTAELYALNAYGRGGHFVGHKDTPRDPSVFGTLVVCLPVRFRGGRLVLTHDAATKTFDWQSDGYYAKVDPCQLEWAAFYGDVDHEVEPVTEGTRVTLTWLLRRASGVGSPREAAPADAKLRDTIFDALGDGRFLPRGGTLGVPCVHLYAEAPGRARATGALTRSALGRLKGRDRVVATIAESAGLDVRYRPYLYDTGCNEAWRLKRAPTTRERAIFDTDRLTPDDLDELPLDQPGDFWGRPKDDVTWILDPPWVWSGDSSRPDELEPGLELLGELEYSATGYFGNEGSDAAFYVAGALLLDVDPASERWLDASAEKATRRRARKR